jgi:hypothetical protein
MHAALGRETRQRQALLDHPGPDPFSTRSFVMIQKEAPARAEKLSSLNAGPPAIATMAKKRFEELAEIQSDLL